MALARKLLQVMSLSRKGGGWSPKRIGQKVVVLVQKKDSLFSAWPYRPIQPSDRRVVLRAVDFRAHLWRDIHIFRGICLMLSCCPHLPAVQNLCTAADFCDILLPCPSKLSCQALCYNLGSCEGLSQNAECTLTCICLCGSFTIFNSMHADNPVGKHEELLLARMLCI